MDHDSSSSATEAPPPAPAAAPPPPVSATGNTSTSGGSGGGGGSDLPKRKGRVKWFNSSKGYGFITPDEGSSTEDVFVHQTAIHAQGFRSLQQGEEVEYVAEEGEDGRWRAVEVKGPKGAYVQGATRYGSRVGRGRAATPTNVSGAGGGATTAPPPPAVIPTAAVSVGAARFPRFGGVCYSCGMIGHMSRDCRSAGFYSPPPLPLGRGRGRAAGPPAFPRSCYACGGIGHFQRDCPNFAPTSLS